MPKAARILALTVFVLGLFAALGVAYLRRGAELDSIQLERDQIRAEFQRLEAALGGTRDELGQHETVLEAARQRLAVLEAANTRLREEKESIARSQLSLEAEMRRALESRDVTISELQGKLTVDILDRVLFDSGEATLKEEGRHILQRVADVLAQYPNRQIHVIGHTDNVPIRAGARGRYPSNWELSTARATAAVRFLSEQAGVQPPRLGAVGYGEFRPVADNATPEGRAKNRRIALVVLSEELVGADTVPTVRELPVLGSATNAPPDAATNAPPDVSTNAPLEAISDPLSVTATNAPPTEPVE
jgi:chemotaxis protein MotB